MDVVLTSTLFVVLALACVASFIFSGFFVMATANCGPDDCGSGITWAYAITWGGIGVAAYASVVAAFVDRGRRFPLLTWPLLGIVLVVVTYFLGGSVANSIM